MKNIHEKIGLIAIMLASSLALFIFLPTPFTAYSQPNDGNLSPADAITSQTPLQQCIQGDFHNLTSMELLLATYARMNTNINHFEIFIDQNNLKKTIFQTDFSSESVKNNDYFSINFPNIPQTDKLCFLLTSGDASPQNSITYWLNSQSQPVLKLTSTEPLYKVIRNIAEASQFDLPIWLVSALCLLYLCANIGAIFLIWNEASKSKKSSKTTPSHSRRTRQKRI